MCQWHTVVLAPGKALRLKIEAHALVDPIWPEHTTGSILRVRVRARVCSRACVCPTSGHKTVSYSGWARTGSSGRRAPRARPRPVARDYKGLHAFPSSITRDGPPMTRDYHPPLILLQGITSRMSMHARMHFEGVPSRSPGTSARQRRRSTVSRGTAPGPSISRHTAAAVLRRAVL